MISNINCIKFEEDLINGGFNINICGETDNLISMLVAAMKNDDEIASILILATNIFLDEDEDYDEDYDEDKALLN